MSNIPSYGPELPRDTIVVPRRSSLYPSLSPLFSDAPDNLATIPSPSMHLELSPEDDIVGDIFKVSEELRTRIEALMYEYMQTRDHVGRSQSGQHLDVMRKGNLLKIEFDEELKSGKRYIGVREYNLVINLRSGLACGFSHRNFLYEDAETTSEEIDDEIPPKDPDFILRQAASLAPETIVT